MRVCVYLYFFWLCCSYVMQINTPADPRVTCLSSVHWTLSVKVSSTSWPPQSQHWWPPHCEKSVVEPGDEWHLSPVTFKLAWTPSVTWLEAIYINVVGVVEDLQGHLMEPPGTSTIGFDQRGLTLDEGPVRLSVILWWKAIHLEQK